MVIVISYLGALASNMAFLVAVVASTAATAASAKSTTTASAKSTATASAEASVTAETASTAAAATAAERASATESAAATASATGTTIAAGVGAIDLDLLAIHDGAVQLLDGALSGLVVGHGHEGVALLGDVDISDLTAPEKMDVIRGCRRYLRILSGHGQVF